MPIPSLLVSVALAQSADQSWRTLRTEHFRVHYPEVAAPWAEHAAARLEAWHARVVEEVGYTPAKTIDAVVIDPYSDANGFALPFSTRPRTAWFTTPPEAGSSIAHNRTWDEILIVHEDAHLAHLMRAPRNPLERVAYQLFGLGPVTTKSPRWVIEGYATVVEGRLTGSGRPNGDARATLLRNLARRGELPPYEALDANGDWAGGGYAYLVGSAYLEWLEARAGEGSLRDLWVRLTARQPRSFVDAFTGVFGEAPDVLYRRFCAELTGSAMAIDREDPPDTAPFQRLGWSVPALDVSPTGDRVAVARFPREGLPKIEVYAVAPDAEATEERAEAAAKRAERDPEDVPDRVVAEPHERVATRTSAGRAARDLRWTADGASLVYAGWTRDRTGRLRSDLFRWTLDGGVERLTRNADLRAPDPGPDGTWAVAVRTDWGRTQIVQVDLATGAVVELTPLSVTQVDGPRVSPDGGRLAWLENGDGGFGVVVLDRATGRRTTLASEPGGLTTYSLAWSADGRSLYGTAGADGLVEVYELLRDGARGRGRLSATGGTAFAADQIDDGSALVLDPSRGGLDLRRAPLADRSTVTAGAPPVRRPPVPDAPGMPDPVDVASRPYGVGPTDVSLFAGFGTLIRGEQAQAEFAARLGDPIGRSEVLLVSAFATDRGGTSGARGEWTYRGWPVELDVDVYLTHDAPYDAHRAGVAVGGGRKFGAGAWSGSGRAAVVVEAPTSELDPNGARQLGWVAASVGAVEPDRRWIGASASVQGVVGRADAIPYGQVTGGVAVQVLAETPIVARYDFGSSSGDRVLDRFGFGGLTSSLTVAAADAWRIRDPAFAAGSARGGIHDHVELSLDTPVGLFVERRRIGDLDLAGHGFSAVGVRGRTAVDPQPIARVPATRFDLGAACRFEYPGLGWDPSPCQQLSDYTAWMNVTFGR